MFTSDFPMPMWCISFSIFSTSCGLKQFQNHEYSMNMLCFYKYIYILIVFKLVVVLYFKCSKTSICFTIIGVLIIKYFFIYKHIFKLKILSVIQEV